MRQWIDEAAIQKTSLYSMIQEISFHEYREEIAQLRRDTFGAGLIHAIDEFDEVAHHFALFDAARGMIGSFRLLRNDEVPKLEMQCESGAQGLVLPEGVLIMETSRGCAGKGAVGMPMIKMSLAIKKYAAEHKAAYLISKTARLLLPIYQSMGYRVFGKPFYSDWFDEKDKQDPSIPIILKFDSQVAPQEEEILVW